MPDDFSPTARHLIAKRAGGLCANPLCRRACPPAGAEAGMAVTIEGLRSPGRPAADTGIWLCDTCAATVQQDPSAYPSERLMAWKEDHAEHVLTSGLVPVPPLLAIRTLADLHPTTQRRFDPPAEAREWLRDHEILVSNQGLVPIAAIRLRFQFPESVVCPVAQYVPAGVACEVSPEKGGSPQGGDSSTYPVFHLTISRLAPGEAVALVVRCVQDRSLAALMPADSLWCDAHFVQGSYALDEDAGAVTYDVIATLGYHTAQRQISVLRIADDLEAFPRTELVAGA